jgi:hypothetical protein
MYVVNTSAGERGGEEQVDAQMLEKQMQKAAVDDENMAESLRLEPEDFARKMSGEADFKVQEIRIIKRKLHLKDKDVDQIFFSE